MLSCLNQINLIRYLIVWRINSSLAFFPRFASLDISSVLGSIISQRLPTVDKNHWQKTLNPLNKTIEQIKNKQLTATDSKFPDSAWPVKSTIFVYPIKRSYSKDELFFWELKLFGEDADHGFFLEVILPAMEEACITTNQEWNQRNRLWGHFDILNIYAAQGNIWQPFVTNGKLNLEYRVNPKQWLEGLRFTPNYYHKFKHIDWIVPAEFSDDLPGYHALDLPDEKQKLKFSKAPPLSLILHSLVQRINKLLYAPSKKSKAIDEILNAADQKEFLSAFQQSLPINIVNKKLLKVPLNWPGKYYGSQRYSSIPYKILPYLNVASILHIGKYTHFGCGTFELK